MSSEIIRTAVYWIPPDDLGQIMEATWQGNLNKNRACELVFRHSGDCPIWGAHATLLDAVTIMKENRAAFVEAMSDVLRQYLPIRLSNPMVKDWGWPNLVVLRWDKDEERKRLKRLRKDLMTRARDFLVLEQVSWEAITELERRVDVFADQVDDKFKKALAELKERIMREPLRVPYAPNIPLDWYVRSLACSKSIMDGTLPFPPSPHVSVATAIRHDDKYQKTAEGVTKYINDNLRKADGWKDVLGGNITHMIDSAYIMEPAPISVQPLDVVVIDRVSKQPRKELRQPWTRKERLPL